MTPANPDALADGADDGPTEAETQAMHEEAENFRLPAPPPTPVRGRYYLTECEHCGWVGSSEHCGGNYGPDDDDIVCPVCCSSICGDSPDEADTAKHGEAVYQRILAAEVRAAQLQAEVEAKDRRIAELSETWTDEGGTVWSPPTAWAYAKACAALRKHRADAEALREALTVAASRMEVASMDWGIAAALNSDKLTHADDMEEWAKHARTALAARAATAREG